ncbi:helix-turn-helix domain-containing protein [Pelomonas sp. CA6]|uniref:helix-turn-helix domain-containing protein n=1 Tax=Pelomonas sp. CA6 TaxID=2907999 RepID=UPI001F4BD67F|nr:helix-turn-helix domain-containing protein [Pelomonas sp. CA6]MCH7343367.1 helix-turn-helix domain-containing protein [Pelomonas sp. CA6]
MSASPAAALWMPDAELAPCLRAGVMRDTRALGELPLAQRINRFPAHPYCGITWLLEGDGVLTRCGGQDCQRRLPRVFLSGPQRHPVQSLNLGPLHSFFLVFQPAGLARLFGLEPEHYRDRHVALDEVPELARALQPLHERILAAPDDAARWRASLDWLRPLWRERCAGEPDRLGTVLAGIGQLGVRAAAAWMGWSERHLQRRGRALTGLRPAELRRLQRAETAVRAALLAEQAGGWAGVAAQHGYADQAHLGREVKAIAGHSPDALRRAVHSDDASWWVYRLDE